MQSVIIATVALVITSATVALQDSSEPLTIAIDTTIEGNTDSEIGEIDTCVELANVGDTVTFDLVVLNVPEDSRIGGYQIDIDYDPLVIEIVDVIDVDAAGSEAPNNVTILSRVDSSRGFEFLRLSEDMPDQDGSLTASAIDGTNDPFPPENHESGDGVLARITAEAVGLGVSDLTVPGPAGGFDGNIDKIINAGNPPGEELDVRLVTGGRISVGEPCVAPVTASVAPPSETATPGPGETTPPDGSTPGPGETGSPADTTAPGNGNGGTNGDTNGDSDGDGGSDALLVIAVIAAVWVAAAGISAAWYFMRRRNRGGAPPGSPQ